MAQNTEKILADFDKRISYQEQIHKGVIDNPDMVHGLVNNAAVILITSAAITLIAVSIIFYTTKKNESITGKRF